MPPRTGQLRFALLPLQEIQVILAIIRLPVLSLFSGYPSYSGIILCPLSRDGKENGHMRFTRSLRRHSLKSCYSSGYLSRFSRFSRRLGYPCIGVKNGKQRKNLGGYLGVNGRQKQIFMDCVDISMILTRANIHEVFLKRIAFSGFTKNPLARSGSQEVASSILASSTIKSFKNQYLQSTAKILSRGTCSWLRLGCAFGLGDTAYLNLMHLVLSLLLGDAIRGASQC